MNLQLRILPEHLAVCRLAPNAEVPSWAASGQVRSLTWTPRELSIVCLADVVPTTIQAERGWRGLEVAGPLDFSLTGILLAIAKPLAEASISLFALSTFDTDYVLVRDEDLNAAIQALSAAGHRILY